LIFYKKLLSELNQGAQNDSKSSAGDKHETARAMMQLEQEKIGKQLQEAEEINNALNKIDTQLTSKNIAVGSLVKTNFGYFYLAAALGKLIINNQEVYVLSPKSPLGLKLIGLTSNSNFEINARKYSIENFQ
jgi:transcription elongation GreA/GreB family factor